MEKTQRKRMVSSLRRVGLDPGSVENSAGPGTPDIQFIGGWAELKWLANWPRRVDAPIRIDHFTPQQRVWLLRRWRAGGLCWLVLQVEKAKQWLVFDGDVAANRVGQAMTAIRADRDALHEMACFTGRTPDEVADYIKGRVCNHRQPS